MNKPHAIDRHSGRTDRSAPELLSVLVCPLTRTPLIYDSAKNRLVSLQAGLCYPITDHVPVMLEEAAAPLSQQDRDKWMKRTAPGNAGRPVG